MQGEASTIKRMICICLAMVFLFSFSAPVFGQTLKKVRVGFFQNAGYHKMDGSGEKSGFGYEIIQHIIGYTDWDCEYVGYDKSWSEMLEMLENGEIDLLTNTIMTEERKEKFDFSKRPLGTSASILSVKAGNSQYAVDDYSNWDGIRVGMLDHSIQSEEFMSFAKEKGFTYRPVYFQSIDDILYALKTEESIDAAVSNNLRTIEGEWIYAELSVSPFYAVVKKGNTQLLNDVNHALEMFYQDTPLLQAEIWNKYYASTNSDVIGYTAEEIDYIEQMKTSKLKAIIHPDLLPYSKFEKGQPIGINSELVKEIIRRSGLNIEFIQCKDADEYQRLSSSKEIDICLDAQQNFSLAEAKGFRLTIPYYKETNSILYRKGDSRNHQSVALLDSWNLSKEGEQRLFSEYIDFVYYDSADEAVEAVLKGKQDAAYLLSGTSTRAVRNDITNHLASEKLVDDAAYFCMAVNATQDTRLYSILNKAIASISENQKSQIIQKYPSYEEIPFSLLGYVYDNPLLLLFTVIVLFVLIILALVVVYLSKKRIQENALLIEEKRRNQLLIDALEVAEKADVAKSQFLSRVSHEMRTPLNAIIGFIGLAQENNGAGVNQYLNNSEIAAKQLLSVINDVLDMSAIESGKIKIANEPFHFKQVIDSIGSIYGAQFEHKGIQFEIQILSPLDEWVIGDQLRLNQILLNLLGNAMKFTEKGSVKLKIRQLVPKTNKAFIRLEVTDTGCGMTREMQRRLFKPFEQESAITAQKFGGSGLGLSIVKNLVSLMDGAIRVESTINVGSSFIVDLPFTKKQDEVKRLTPQGFKKLNVLVVNADGAEGCYISEVLDSFGIRNTCMVDGEDTFVMLESGVIAGDKYNVCMLDWKIPISSRLELIREIRRVFGMDTYIVILMPPQCEHEKKKMKAGGVDLFATKPLFSSTIYDVFITVLEKFDSDAVQQPYQPKNILKSLEGMRVLLAEDNTMNSMVAIGLLKKFGVECDVAKDGEIALEKFIVSNAGYYDAILMDVQMPNMDGFQATRRIRESSHPDAKKVYIIALTANAFNEDITKSFSQGMNDHVSKPIDTDELYASLSRAMNKKRGGH